MQWEKRQIWLLDWSREWEWSTDGLALSVMDFRFIWIFGHIRIWRLVWDGFLVFAFWKILITRIFLKVSVNSGGDGTSPFQPGFAIMCIFLWAEAGAVWQKTAGIFWLYLRWLVSGMGQAGTFSFGDFTLPFFWFWKSFGCGEFWNACLRYSDISIRCWQ